MDVRNAVPGDRAGVRNVLDGALLDIDATVLERALDDGDVLVAVERCENSDCEGPVLGALVLDGDEIVAIGVRMRRRNAKIGTALVERAHCRRGRLVAEFDGRVRPFWASLGFDIEPVTESDRYRGTLEGDG